MIGKADVCECVEVDNLTVVLLVESCRAKDYSGIRSHHLNPITSIGAYDDEDRRLSRHSPQTSNYIKTKSPVQPTPSSG